MRRTVITAFVATAAALLAACGTTAEPDSAAKPDAPTYKITKQTERGAQHYIDVEVQSTDRLTDVFAAVAAGLTDEAGYFVAINCAAGSSSEQAHRLANGTIAIGDKGTAATGLPAGQKQFTQVDGATCP